MSTEVQDVKLVKEQDLATQIAETRGHVNHLAMQVSLLSEQIRTQINSRRGESGGKGDVGNTGAAGRDAVLIIKEDTRTNTVRIFDGDKVAAEIVAVVGPAGHDGKDAVARDGKDGRPGKDAPSLDEIIRGVLKAVKEKI